MAYAFTKINELVQGDSDPQKQDIFAEEGGDGSVPMTQAGSVPKTTTEGDIGGGACYWR